MLYKIEALNYRCLHYVSQTLAPFQILVGPNASGKSTFLDVVALLGDFVRSGLDDSLLLDFDIRKGRASKFSELIFNQLTDYFDVAIEFYIPENLLQKEASAKSAFSYDLARYEVSFGRRETGELEIRAEQLWLIDSQRDQQRRQSGSSRQYSILFPAEPEAPKTIINSAKTRPGWRPVVRKVQTSGNDYFKSESSDWNIMFRVGTRRAALSGLPDDAARFPVAIWVRDQLLEGVRLLALNSVSMRRPVSPSRSRDFSVEGANLPLVIQDLEKQDPLAYGDWVAHVQTILPDIDQILIRERKEDNHLYLAIQYKNISDPVPSWLVSDRTLRLLALTLLAYLR